MGPCRRTVHGWWPWRTPYGLLVRALACGRCPGLVPSRGIGAAWFQLIRDSSRNSWRLKRLSGATMRRRSPKTKQSDTERVNTFGPDLWSAETPSGDRNCLPGDHGDCPVRLSAMSCPFVREYLGHRFRGPIFAISADFGPVTRSEDRDSGWESPSSAPISCRSRRRRTGSAHLGCGQRLAAALVG